MSTITTKTSYFVDGQEFSDEESARKYISRLEDEHNIKLDHDANITFLYNQFLRYNNTRFDGREYPRLIIHENKFDTFYYLVENFNDFFLRLAEIYDYNQLSGFYRNESSDVLESIANYVNPTMAKAAYAWNNRHNGSIVLETFS